MSANPFATKRVEDSLPVVLSATSTSHGADIDE
jgi:hypothetical protein